MLKIQNPLNIIKPDITCLELDQTIELYQEWCRQFFANQFQLFQVNTYRIKRTADIVKLITRVETAHYARKETH